VGNSPRSAVPWRDEDEDEEVGEMTDGTYVITVRGVAGPWVRAAFDDVALSTAGDTTVLRDGTDQAALHGLLRRIQDLGLELLDVHLESAEPT
jgi:hypothetical protein